MSRLVIVLKESKSNINRISLHQRVRDWTSVIETSLPKLTQWMTIKQCMKKLKLKTSRYILRLSMGEVSLAIHLQALWAAITSKAIEENLKSASRIKLVNYYVMIIIAGA